MDLYALLGYPLSHSFSSRFFREKFLREKIDADYINLEMKDISSLLKVIEERENLVGMNVTIPYKQAVLSFLSDCDEMARNIGAVNCIKIEREKGKDVSLTGYNTDAVGFRDSLMPLLSSSAQKAMVLGTGGASKAVLFVLKEIGLNTTLVSRNGRGNILSYADITPELLHSQDLIVNCTPVGMSPHVNECPQIPYEALSSHQILYDLIYNPEETLFLKRGRARGTAVKNGLEMLHLQAEAAWRIWHE